MKNSVFFAYKIKKFWSFIIFLKKKEAGRCFPDN